MADSAPPSPNRVRKRPRKALDLPTLTRIMSLAILSTEEVLLTSATVDDRLRAIHAVSTAIGAYGKLLEASTIEARLSALEARLHQGRMSHNGYHEAAR
jgi:hypothetical protein